MPFNYTAADDNCRIVSTFNITAAPWAVWFRFKLSALGTARVFVELSNQSTFPNTATDFFRCAIDATNHITAQTQAAGAASTSTTTGTVADTNYHDAIAIFDSPTARTAGLDGTLATTQTTSRTPTGIITLSVGLTSNNTLDYSGLIEHLAMWGGSGMTIGSTEFTNLHNGISPTAVDRAHLLHYWPGTDSATLGRDIVGGTNLTINGSVAYSATSAGTTRAPMAVTQRYHRMLRSSQ